MLFHPNIAPEIISEGVKSKNFQTPPLPGTLRALITTGPNHSDVLYSHGLTIQNLLSAPLRSLPLVHVPYHKLKWCHGITHSSSASEAAMTAKIRCAVERSWHSLMSYCRKFTALSDFVREHPLCSIQTYITRSPRATGS